MKDYIIDDNISVPSVGSRWATGVDANGNGEVYEGKIVKEHVNASMAALRLKMGIGDKGEKIFVENCGTDGYGSVNSDGSPVNWKSDETKRTKFRQDVRALELNGNITTI